MSDIDDDLDEVVSAADTQIWFQDEVVDLINKSLQDRAVYSCLIGELEQIRQAHSQKPAALNKEVVRTMIYLPFSVNSNINGDLEVYGSTFSELLEKYDPLLRSLNKNKEAQLTGVDHVTTPFLELIRSDKLSAADWLTRKVGPVLNTLKNHYIIEEVRIKEAMAVIENGITEIVHQRNVQHMEMDQQHEAERRSLMSLATDSNAASVLVPISTPAVVPADSQQGPEDMEVELVGVLKPQPDREDCPLLEKERHRQQSPLTSERFSGKFDHKGGTLDTHLTNDYLYIPPGAIPEGTVYSIWGTVHSALDKFDKWVRKDKGERLIAPVDEICVEGNEGFLKPVTLVIHHAVTKHELLAKVEIKLLEDDGSELDVKPAHKRTKGKPWFEINSECIKIHTLQLCKALCKVDSGKKIEGKLRGILYGQMYEKGGKYIAEVEFYFQFCRSVQSLQGQIGNFRSWRTDSGCAYLDTQDFATSPDRLNSEDKFDIEFVFSEEDANNWVLRKESDNRESEVIPLKCIIPCFDNLSDDPINVTKYAFNNTTSSVTFPLVAKLKAKIVHEPPNGSYGISLGIKMPRMFGRQYNEESAQAQAQASATGTKQELTEKKMNEIAKIISPDNLDELAIELNIRHVELLQIMKDNPNNSRRQSFLVLYTWYSRLPPPKTNAIAQLKAALLATSNGDAANILTT